MKVLKPMKKLKLLPPFVTLLAGAITSISLFILKWDFLTSLLILLGVIVVFYVIGTAAKMLIQDMSSREKPKEIEGEGEVIDKTDGKEN
ncbi:MAG: hypothetical protein PUE21_05360 [Lachnospiraceae bacterium]|nr:hypothetical protein [Lachnospiraceae bacterium]